MSAIDAILGRLFDAGDELELRGGLNFEGFTIEPFNDESGLPAGWTITLAGAGPGSGDVTGPSSAIDGTPMLADGTTGALIKNGPINLAGGANHVTGVLPKANQDRGFSMQVGTDANTTITANSFVLVPTTTAIRTYSLPATPSDGDFALVRVTNAYAFSVSIAGNGHNIDDGIQTAASTYGMANDGETLWFVYSSSLGVWVIA